MKTLPRLSFWQIWNMNFGFLGIQFGYALQNANVSRIFETLGANIETIPILWIAAPVTGLIVQPIVGYYSDKTWGKLGRRRPYFLVGAILASIALIIMPNSPTLWVAAGMLWIMDASINISQEPFRAFVGDLLPSKQRTLGFSMQTFFIGIGAVVASALPYILTNWIGISNTAPEGKIPDSVTFSFYIGAVIFIAAVAWTVFTTKEYSPEELQELEEYKDETTRNRASGEFQTRTLVRKAFKIGIFSFVVGAMATALVFFRDLTFELYIVTLGLTLFGLIEIISAFLQQSGRRKLGLVEIFNDFNVMPRTMVQLSFVQFFSWFALFAMWIYTTAGVTSHLYDMNMDQAVVSELRQTIQQVDEQAGDYKAAKDVRSELNQYHQELKSTSATEVTASMKVIKFFTSEEKMERFDLSEAARQQVTRIQSQYNEGADWVGVCFSIYNGAAIGFAFLLVYLAKVTNRKITHMISLIVGGISFVSIYFISNPTLLIVPFIGIGLAWASILAMPYAILTGALPANKLGVYMGIFNFFIVIPQILAATILGFITKNLFDGQAIYALVLGGFTWLLAGTLVVFVYDKDQPNE
ncbi:MAG TPA: MFS transporter [Bacteroidales bacterium]|nr:MFS transporter [Bacteroidales bacterium]